MGQYWYEKLLEKCPCGKVELPENRTIYLDNAPPPDVEVQVTDKTEKYPNNRVVSSRYTAYNFIPKNLFEQFHRIANFYFLCMGIIALIIDGPVSPWTSILPLIFVVLVTAVKQGYEDWLRHKADKEVNNRITILVHEGKEKEIQSRDIQVGNIIKVRDNEEIPCDLVMLSSEDESGECSITTANLDGETNLKTFNCVSETQHLQTANSFLDFQACIECQQPITDLYRFIGRIHTYREDQSRITRSLGAENVLLRGCRVKNTPFAYGCAIYTGQDTKMALNSRFKSTKFSRVEKRMNAFLVIFLLVLLIYCGIWTGLKYWFYSYSDNHTEKAMWYVRPFEEAASFKNVISDYLSFMVLANYIIPISMYVTIELMKVGGKIFFEWDIEMYDPKTDEPAKANTSDINEELGQVEYLFTDKTGTLTENEMNFRQCSVNGIKYEEHEGKLCFKPDIDGVIPRPLPKFTPEVESLFTVLSLCHTARVERSNGLAPGVYSDTGSDYEYHSPSPDEKALLEACARNNIIYHGSKAGDMEVTYDGEMRRFALLHVLEFDPTRKRMSCIVKFPNGDIYLVVKGAETAILDRCVQGCVDSVENHIVDFAVLGLRTLCIAQRKLTQAEFEEFDVKLREAKSALENRDEKVSEVYDEIERDFTLLGATAVEDKLQDGVPETLISLREAGIQVWVVTGDKEETAINISLSAGHFSREMIQLKLTKQQSEEQCAVTLQSLVELLDSSEDSGRQHALVIDGKSLAYCIENFKDQLRHITFRVTTVLCCRMSPLQKAQVVRLIKTSKQKPTTAAIGDGANDVSMIQEAHVGLGIMGKEGRQAVRCSDYAFGRFRFLKRCLLVHGHFFYWRIANLIQYSFYKNVAMITAQVYFTFFTAYSIVSIYESIFLTMYNITFTSLPVFLYGILEKRGREEIFMSRPSLYRKIRKNERLTFKQFLKWNILGLWHSLVFFFGAYFAFLPDQAPSADGKLYGVYEFGAIIMTTCVITVNVKLMLETYLWNGIILAGFLITFAGYPALLFLYSEVIGFWFSSTILSGVFQTIWGSGYVWFVMLLLVVTALLPDIILRFVTDMFSDMFVTKRQKSKSGDCFARNNKITNRQTSFRDKISVSLTKRSGTLTISQQNILDDKVKPLEPEFSNSIRQSTETTIASATTTSGDDNNRLKPAGCQTITETSTGYLYTTNGHSNPGYIESDSSTDHVTSEYRVGEYVTGRVEVPQGLADNMNNNARGSGRRKSAKKGTIISTHL